MNETLSAHLTDTIPVDRVGRDEDLKLAVAAKARALLALARRAYPDWSPPPFDPAVCAEALGIPIAFAGTPLGADALLIPRPREGFRIVCNPRVRTPGRIAFSLAHELAHTFFSDASRTLRMRARTHGEALTPAERELESLCDLGAAELLMPEDHFRGSVAELGPGAAALPLLSERYAVSLEAACLRRLQCDEGRVRAVGIFHFSRRPSERKASRSGRKAPPAGRAAVGARPAGRVTAGSPPAGRAASNASSSGRASRQPEPAEGYEIPTYRVRRVFSAPGLPYLFPEGKSVPRDSVVYRASLGNLELRAQETVALHDREERFEVSAFPLWDFSGPLKPPTVCAVFSAP